MDALRSAAYNRDVSSGVVGFLKRAREEFRRRDRGAGRPLEGSYWLTRIVFLRCFGLIYLVAFYSLTQQLEALIGESGLMPASTFVERIRLPVDGSALAAFIEVPSLFMFYTSDPFLLGCCWFGVVLSTVVVLGYANGITMAILWFLYMSFVHVGQLFYGYGWEMMTLEGGFLAIFLCHPWRGGLLPKNYATPVAVLWLYRWFLFRVMFGAGLIKIRGDEAWRDLTALHYHFETQPIPNPLSWYFHHLPEVALQAGVAFNHFVELIVPLFLFWPRRHRHWAGLLTIVFQVSLILSGNLSFLNWLTIAIAIPCFDDRALRCMFPKLFRDRVEVLQALEAGKARRPRRAAAGSSAGGSPGMARPAIIFSAMGIRRIVIGALACVLLYLSWWPFRNMIFPARGQLMNASFDRLNLVNTYGAFGSVGKVRREIVLQGTRDETPDDRARWLEYEFKGKPNDVFERPPVISPYHYRLDWQIWFAAMSSYQREPWLVYFVYKLLEGDANAAGLLEDNPFGNEPPRYIRAVLYEYEFTEPEERRETGAWWKRRPLGLWMPPVSREDASLRQFLRQFGWETD